MEMNKYIHQYQLAEQTKSFLDTWGLKQRFVADTCKISEHVFSQFMNHKMMLSDGQMNRLVSYMAEYVRRNT